MPVPETFYSSVNDKLHTAPLFLDTDVHVTEEQPKVVVTNNIQEPISNTITTRSGRKPLKLNDYV